MELSTFTITGNLAAETGRYDRKSSKCDQQCDNLVTWLKYGNSLLGFWTVVRQLWLGSRVVEKDNSRRLNLSCCYFVIYDTYTCRAARTFNVPLHEKPMKLESSLNYMCAAITRPFSCFFFFFQNPKQNKVDHLLFSTLCKWLNVAIELIQLIMRMKQIDIWNFVYWNSVSIFNSTPPPPFVIRLVWRCGD